MKDVPRPPQGKGAVALTAETAQGLCEAIAARTPRPGKGLLVKEEPDGVYFWADKVAVEVDHPWKATWLEPTEDDPPLRRLNVLYGTVSWYGSVMVPLIGGTAMDPDGGAANALEAGEVDSGEGWVLLHGSIDDTDPYLGIVDLWEVVWSPGPDIPENTTTDVYQPLAYVSGAGVISQQAFFAFGGMRMGPPGSGYVLWSV